MIVVLACVDNLAVNLVLLNEARYIGAIFMKLAGTGNEKYLHSYPFMSIQPGHPPAFIHSTIVMQNIFLLD